MPETRDLAQRRRTSIATLPPHSFVAPISPTFYSPSISHKAPSEASYYQYEAASNYSRSNVAPLSSPVTGYPYIPHNPTLDELEACSRRIETVKLRCATRQKPMGRLADISATPASCHSGEDAFHFATNPPDLPSLDTSDSGESSWDELELDRVYSPITPSSSQGQSWRAGMSKSITRLPEAASYARHYKPADLFPEAIDLNASTHKDQSKLPGDSSLNGTRPSDDSALAYATIEQITYDLNSGVLGFSFPPKLDFITPDPQGTLPRLAYTAQNKSLLEHKHHLENLLDKLDDVQPHGHEGVRRARKEAVDRVTQAINDLSQRQEMAWYNVSTSSPFMHRVGPDRRSYLQRLYEQRAGSA